MKYKLKELFELQMGKTPSRDNQEYWNSKEHKWISIADLSKCGKYISETKECLSAKAVSESGIKIIPANTVIMSFKLSIGKTAITSEDMYSNEAIMAFHDKHTVELLPEYIYYMFKYKNWDEGSNKAVMGKTLNKATLSEIEIEVCPIEQQREIIKLLDRVVNIIDSRNEEISKLDELIKARFVELFGDPEENPFGWDKVPLSEVIINANNGMARRGNDEDGNIVMRLVELQDGYIDYSNPNRIILKENEKKRYLLKDKDFLFARVNGNPDNVGRCAVFHDIGEDVYHNDHIIRVHFNDELLEGTFASALLNSDYGKRQLKSQIKTSAGQYTVSQDGIGAIVTILPSMDKQNQFAAFVAQVDKSKVAIQKSLNETQLLFDSLMQQYFE
ncbi:MAG: restriction endonuclease subunit S [Clostridiales bacterium]|nr:restriction endonuclease subunit S [Candidatus Scatonaster coprocaballi]